MTVPITPDYVRLMAAYSAWQNQSLLVAAHGIGEAARRAERGAFFGSIHKTFSHLLWGDQIWMSRFAGSPPPCVDSIKGSASMIEDWSALRAERTACDDAIRAWAAALAASRLSGELRWRSASLGREVSRPMALLVTHFFNHQTHHRGQIHAMLTAAGARPEPTDLFAMPGLERHARS